MAKRIVAATPNATLANQFHNPANPHTQYITTGPEMWEQTVGRVSDVVAGILIMYAVMRFLLGFTSSYQIIAFGLTQSQLVALAALAVAAPLILRLQLLRRKVAVLR